MEQAKFTYSPYLHILCKAFEKQIKTIEEQGKKQVEALEVIKSNTQKLTIKDVIPENTLTGEARNELNKIKEIEKMVDRANLVYTKNKHTYSFKNFQTINTICRDIYNRTITLKGTDTDLSDLLIKILNFFKKIKVHNPEKKQEKRDIFKNLYALFDGIKRVLDTFESKTFPIKIKGTGFSDEVLDSSNLKI